MKGGAQQEDVSLQTAEGDDDGSSSAIVFLGDNQVRICKPKVFDHRICYCAILDLHCISYHVASAQPDADLLTSSLTG